jgi:hypothetical protein
MLLRVGSVDLLFTAKQKPGLGLPRMYLMMHDVAV